MNDHFFQLPVRLGGLGMLILSEVASEHFESSKKMTAHFVLNKKEFRDAINLRYGKDLKGLPSKCPCGQSFNMTHALNCKTGGFVTIRHNRVKYFEAQLPTEICNDVEIEPPLQPLQGEIINGLAGVNAKPDVRARGFWREGQNAFFNVRITNTNSESQRHLTSEKIFTKHESEKKRQYNNSIINVEHPIRVFHERGNDRRVLKVS